MERNILGRHPKCMNKMYWNNKKNLKYFQIFRVNASTHSQPFSENNKNCIKTIKSKTENQLKKKKMVTKRFCAPIPYTFTA